MLRIFKRKHNNSKFDQVDESIHLGKSLVEDGYEATLSSREAAALKLTDAIVELPGVPEKDLQDLIKAELSDIGYEVELA